YSYYTSRSSPLLIRDFLPLALITFFFFNDTATSEIYTLSLHDALPISSLFIGPYIYKPLANKGYVNQFQLAQIDSGIYELRIKKEKQDPDSETLEVIKNNLNEVLGRKAVIKFTMLNDIPALPSGKRPVYKNEMLSKS